MLTDLVADIFSRVDLVDLGRCTVGSLAHAKPWIAHSVHAATVAIQSSSVTESLSHATALLGQTVAGSGSESIAAPASAATTTAAAAGGDADALSDMPEWFLQLLPYGPWAIFFLLVFSGVGLHISEDFILIPAGFFAATTDRLPLWETLVLAYFGLIIGDMLWISLCRRFGTRFIQTRWFKRMVHPRRLLQAKHQMEERGIVVVILARFIPGTRTPVITMAGLLHMPWWKLLAVELTTVAVTVPLQTGIGYLAGKGIGNAKSTGELIFWLLALLAATIAVMLGIHWWVQSRSRGGAAPRSKAAWLRTFGKKRRDTAASVQ
ncbi:MAG: DedA family protein [Phycisphaerales bacterium]